MKMLEDVVLSIQNIPGSLVDVGIAQGASAFGAQVRLLEGEDASEETIDAYISLFRKYLREIQEWVLPYELPEDYLFFLSYSGGFSINIEELRLFVYGIGVMTEEWYGDLKGDYIIEPKEDGMINIASLYQREGERDVCVSIMLDLVGRIHPYCVIGIKEELGGPGFSTIMSNLEVYSDRWTYMADSFLQWLEYMSTYFASTK